MLCGDSCRVSSLEDWREQPGVMELVCEGAHGRQEEREKKELWAGMGAAPCRCAGFRCLDLQVELSAEERVEVRGTYSECE